jgi:hypothetical protein
MTRATGNRCALLTLDLIGGADAVLQFIFYHFVGVKIFWRGIPFSTRSLKYCMCAALIGMSAVVITRCPCSKLDLRRFIGGFARLAIACLHGHAH